MYSSVVASCRTSLQDDGSSLLYRILSFQIFYWFLTAKSQFFIGKFHMILAKFALFVHKEKGVLQTQVTYHSVWICWEEWGHWRLCWWVLEGWRHTPVRRFWYTVRAIDLWNSAWWCWGHVAGGCVTAWG